MNITKASRARLAKPAKKKKAFEFGVSSDWFGKHLDRGFELLCVLCAFARINAFRFLFLLGVAGLAGCASPSPSPPPPPADLQTAWEGAPESGTAGAALAWWESFGDPVLNELMHRAPARNLDLRAAEARIREARAQRRAAGANLWPEVSGAAEASRQRRGSGDSNGDSDRDDGGSTTSSLLAGLDATWEADVFGRLRREARAAGAEVQAAEADRDGVRLALLGEVARSYLEYRLYEGLAELAQNTAVAEEGTFRITRARFEQGMASRLDLERVVSGLAVVRAQVPQAHAQAEAARYRLALLLATTPEEVAAIVGPRAPVPGSDALAVLLAPTEVIARRPDVRAAERRLAAAVDLRAAAAALRYPRVSLAAFLGLRGEDVGAVLDAGARTWSVSAGLLAPLLDFGRIRAAIDVADARQEQAYLDWELTVRTALQEVQTSIVSYTDGVLRERELAQAVEAARRAARLARLQYAEGVLSLLEVLDTERSLYRTESDWSQARADVSIGLVTLYRSMGIVPPAEGGRAAM